MGREFEYQYHLQARTVYPEVYKLAVHPPSPSPIHIQYPNLTHLWYPNFAYKWQRDHNPAWTFNYIY